MIENKKKVLVGSESKNKAKEKNEKKVKRR